jgi:hypothetical protein
MDKTAIDLQQRVLALMARGVAQPTSDEEFDQLARDIFAFQYERCAPYQAYCQQLKLTPQTVTHWNQIPAVPTSAFKDFALTCFPAGEAVAEFHTSGTTREKAGKHYLHTLELYHAAVVPNFAEYLLRDYSPDGGGQPRPQSRGRDARPTLNDGKRDARPTKVDAQLQMMVLTPSPQEAPHSSLSHMMGVVLQEFGTDDSGYYVEGGQLLVEKLVRDLCEAQWAHQPVFLLGTAFAFVHVFDHLAQQKLKLEMPDGSRAMETGGFKGRSREMSKAELYGLFERFLGIPAARVVNEYGMTELGTQFYDESLQIGRQTDQKTPPPWARVLIIDPTTGREATDNERGLIRVVDLANLWSMVCVQTEDLGISRASGTRSDLREFEVLGRVAGAEVRGCSLNAESLGIS